MFPSLFGEDLAFQSDQPRAGSAAGPGCVTRRKAPLEMPLDENCAVWCLVPLSQTLLFLDQTLSMSLLKVTPIVVEIALGFRDPRCTTTFANICSLLKATQAQALPALHDKCTSE